MTFRASVVLRDHMLKAVAFDLWETLITNSPEISHEQEALRLDRLHAVLRDSGYDASHDHVRAAHKETWTRCHELYWSVDRDISTRQQIIHFLEPLGIAADECAADLLERLDHAYATVAFDLQPALVEGALDVLSVIRHRGLRTGLISNTGRTPGWVLRRILEEQGVAPLIDVMLFSNEHGECKPQASIFAKLREGLGCEPSEIIFVGDNAYVDVYGAAQSGMHGVHFNPHVRGLAVAPPVEVDFDVEPVATINHLPELIQLLDRLAVA
jgi:FMN phosphatase YigB (HAD superfamily)